MGKDTTKRQVLVPHYMKSFQCIGPACEENCCEIGWLVVVDKLWFEAYQKLDHLELKPLLDKYLVKFKRPSDHRYAALTFPEGQNRCQFLNKDKWCIIQSTLGAECLHEICALYPRLWNVINDTYEMAASLSCPEVARLVMLNRTATVFEHIEEDAAQRHNIRIKADLTTLAWSREPEAQIKELRALAITIVQNRRHSLASRLILLGIFCEKLDAAVAENTACVPDYLGICRKLVNEDTEQSLKGSQGCSTRVQMEIVPVIAEIYHRYSFVRNSAGENTFLKHLGVCLDGLGWTENAILEDVADCYCKAYERYYQTFLTDHPYVLENYLVDYIFANVFPARRNGTFLDSFVLLLAHLIFINLLIVGSAWESGELTQEMAVSIACSFHQTVENDRFFLDSICHSLKSYGYDGLVHL